MYSRILEIILTMKHAVMGNKRGRIIFTIVLGIVSLLSFSGSNYARAEVGEDYTCALSLKLEATPAVVTAWTNTVTLKASLIRDRNVLGGYCVTNESATLSFAASNIGDIGNATIEMAGENSGNTTRWVRSATIQVKLSTKGVAKDTAAVGLAVGASVVRSYGTLNNKYGIEPVAARITLKGATQTNTNNGDNSNSNGNDNTNGVVNGNANINTSIGISNVANFDESLGEFFNPLKYDTLPEIVVRAIQILFAIVAGLAVVVIIIAGFRMVAFGSNESEITKAKAALTWAIVGLVVSLMSFSIVAIIQRII